VIRGAEVGLGWDAQTVTMEGPPDPTVLVAGPAAPDGSALALLRLPGVFTQDDLLDPVGFAKEATRRGRNLSLDQLQELHSSRLLLPLFRISDTGATGRAIPVDEPAGLNPRGWVMHAAWEGRLRDCADEGYSVEWPYRQPEPFVRHWHSGCFYSSWQLLDLGWALGELLNLGWRQDYPGRWAGIRLRRARTLALCALTPRHLQGIVGRSTTPGGVDGARVWASRFSIDDQQRLDLVGFRAEGLLPEAKSLLAEAHGDPMIGWWPLIRHAGAQGWEKTAGLTADYLWQRVGAEVLLRAHEELADLGVLSALPTLSHTGWWDELHDRVGAASSAGRSLDQALGLLGVSPHPRVLLLVEGQTEFLHFTRMLELFGLDRADMVRIQNCRTSGTKPDLITRFAIAPRLAEKLGDVQMLHSHPTALIIAMDPENGWTTPAQRDTRLRALKKAIREEVEAQKDGTGYIGDEDLDHLVTLHVWGTTTFELANFTDDELVHALSELAAHQSIEADDLWRVRARHELKAARVAPNDIKVVIQRLGLKEQKVLLAELLWPALLARLEEQAGWEEPTLPILRVLRDVRTRVAQLLGGSYSLRAPGSPAE
jgi:hypothetical protein